MSNPLFAALGGTRNMGGNNPFRIVQEFINFANGFKGDPKAKVQELLRTGQMSQQQLNELQGVAGQFRDLLNSFPKIK